MLASWHFSSCPLPHPKFLQLVGFSFLFITLSFQSWALLVLFGLSWRLLVTSLFCLPLSFLSHSPDPLLTAQFSLLLVFSLPLSLLALDSSRRLWLCSPSNLRLKIISSNIPWSGHVLLTSYTVLSEKAASRYVPLKQGTKPRNGKGATVWERQCDSRRQLCLHPRKQADRKNRWKGL